MAQATGGTSSVTPTQQSIFRHGRSMSNQSVDDPPSSRDGKRLGLPQTKGGRSMSNTGAAPALKGAFLPSGPGPGSFNSDLRSVSFSKPDFQRPEYYRQDSEYTSFINNGYADSRSDVSAEQRQADLKDRISKETKIKVGSENLLDALLSKNAKQSKEQRQKVESELTSTNLKIAQLKSQLSAEIEKSNRPSTPDRRRLSTGGLFQGSPLKSPPKDANAVQSPPLERAAIRNESSTYVLSEILEALEVEGKQPDYYVDRSNSLVELFKRYPTLKYDLVWSIFGLRMQLMLLSQNKDMIAAAYRVIRHSITDRASLRTVRSLKTDELVVISLIKDNKASTEREQALKFVRGFPDVKDGTQELSLSVLRTIVAIAEHPEDRLRGMAILTVSEILLRDPVVAISAGSIAVLAEVLQTGTYRGPEALSLVYVRLLDTPSVRRLLPCSSDLSTALAPFTDPLHLHGNEERLKTSVRAISTILKTWPGLFSMAYDGFSAIRSLLASLLYPDPLAQDLLLDLLFDLLQIRAPPWSTTSSLNRRLTTFGRVASGQVNDEEPWAKERNESSIEDVSLVDHFTVLLLAIMVQCGLREVLSNLVENMIDPLLKRKVTLLFADVLEFCNCVLPDRLRTDGDTAQDMLPVSLSEDSDGDDPEVMTGTCFQIDSISKDLSHSRSAKMNTSQGSGEAQEVQKPSDNPTITGMDDLQFRSLILDTQVLGTMKYFKWKWSLISDIIDGPLRNSKRLEETIRATKFMKRLLGFYQPFKFLFSEARNTKPNQRYVRTGCSLIKALMNNPEGIIYLSESKLLSQIAECLAQLDSTSGIVTESPFFSPYRISETLSGSYFTLLGVMSGDPRGLQMLERWRIINMFYRIMDLDGRDDLIQALLCNLDFAHDSHLRVMLSKGLTACSQDIRIYSTKLLRKYIKPTSNTNDGKEKSSKSNEWIIRLLVTQLYDPQLKVCEVAVKVLEEICDQQANLEYVVRCRPALDHLGEIGAPLLLRFLTTSLGYQYLDRLDYIDQEMDDWFLGRNGAYVTLVEASLARALAPIAQMKQAKVDDTIQARDSGTAPPHFYRELTRTMEGCQLLRESGHFYEFASTIREHWDESQDNETINRLKACLWVVGNIGSVDFGGSFLDDTAIVPWIIRIATTSEILTVRGTAFFVLGLISRSLHGMEILTEHGWDVVTNDRGQSIGYCLPRNLGDFFSISLGQNGQNDSLCAPRQSRSGSRPKTPHEDPMSERVIKLVKDLGNSVLWKRAGGELYSVKAQNPDCFSSVALFRNIMSVLEKHAYRLHVRRFVLDLFEPSVMRRVVLGDDGDDVDVL